MNANTKIWQGKYYLGINDISFHAGAAYGDTEKSFVTLTAVVNVKKTCHREACLAWSNIYEEGRSILEWSTFQLLGGVPL